jgi:hypothetical protein
LFVTNGSPSITVRKVSNNRLLAGVVETIFINGVRSLFGRRGS